MKIYTSKTSDALQCTIKKAIPDIEFLEREQTMPDKLFQLMSENDTAYFMDSFALLTDAGLEAISKFEEDSTKTFLAIRKHGDPFLSMVFFGGKKSALEILTRKAKSFMGDQSIPFQANLSNLILESLGNRVKIYKETPQSTPIVDPQSQKSGLVVAFANEKIHMLIANAKLNAFDIYENQILNYINGRKEVSYENE